MLVVVAFCFDCASKDNKADQFHREESLCRKLLRSSCRSSNGKEVPSLSSHSSWKTTLVFLLLTVMRSIVTSEQDFNTR